MAAISFIGVSIIEYIGILVATLASFRYIVNYYWPQILLTSTICSVLSYVLTIKADFGAAPFIQLAAQAICVWLMFYTPLLWSIVINVSFFVVYVVFQGGVIYLLASVQAVPAVVPKSSVAMYLIQVLCSAISLAIGYFMQVKRIGFLFVPVSRDIPFVWNRTGRWLVIGSAVSCFALGVLYGSYTNSNIRLFAVVLLLLIAIATGLFIIVRRKNHEYVQAPGDR